MLFDGWYGIGRVLLMGTCSYAALLVLLRVSGKRTLTKLSGFDLVVTVAIGSTLSTALLSKDVAFLEGVVALALLIALQYAITWGSARSGWFAGLVHATPRPATPRLLFFGGAFLDSELRRERLTRDELLAVAREQGLSSPEDTGAIVLEGGGDIAVIPRRAEAPPAGLLADLRDAGVRIQRHAD
jgi:uncharacterized membrane protein YcaP (DUF421 family)